MGLGEYWSQPQTKLYILLTTPPSLLFNQRTALTGQVVGLNKGILLQIKIFDSVLSTRPHSCQNSGRYSGNWFLQAGKTFWTELCHREPFHYLGKIILTASQFAQCQPLMKFLVQSSTFTKKNRKKIQQMKQQLSTLLIYPLKIFLRNILLWE